MRLCSYVVVSDKGFAPNPFGGFCTLAACTPNHQGIRLEKGDWLVGNSSAAAGRRLVYAMRVSEVLDFGDYFLDKRFEMKKPSPEKWQTRCGDNIYFRDAEGELHQATGFFHLGQKEIKKDVRNPRVFISSHFFYFGKEAPVIPDQYSALLRKHRGCRCSHSPVMVREFIDWLERTYSPGRLGLPRDRESDCVSGEQGPCSKRPVARTVC